MVPRTACVAAPSDARTARERRRSRSGLFRSQGTDARYSTRHRQRPSATDRCHPRLLPAHECSRSPMIRATSCGALLRAVPQLDGLLVAGAVFRAIVRREHEHPCVPNDRTGTSDRNAVRRHDANIDLALRTTDRSLSPAAHGCDGALTSRPSVRGAPVDSCQRGPCRTVDGRKSCCRSLRCRALDGDVRSRRSTTEAGMVIRRWSGIGPPVRSPEPRRRGHRPDVHRRARMCRTHGRCVCRACRGFRERCARKHTSPSSIGPGRARLGESRGRERHGPPRPAKPIESAIL